jgi:hypothetical protein
VFQRYTFPATWRRPLTNKQAWSSLSHLKEIERTPATDPRVISFRICRSIGSRSTTADWFDPFPSIFLHCWWRDACIPRLFDTASTMHSTFYAVRATLIADVTVLQMSSYFIKIARRSFDQTRWGSSSPPEFVKKKVGLVQTNCWLAQQIAIASGSLVTTVHGYKITPSLLKRTWC